MDEKEKPIIDQLAEFLMRVDFVVTKMGVEGINWLVDEEE